MNHSSVLTLLLRIQGSWDLPRNLTQLTEIRVTKVAQWFLILTHIYVIWNKTVEGLSKVPICIDSEGAEARLETWKLNFCFS